MDGSSPQAACAIAQYLPGMSLLSLEPHFRLGSGCSVAAFNKLPSKRVITSQLPGTHSTKRTLLLVVVLSLEQIRSNLLREHQLAIDLVPTLSSIYIDREPVECIALTFINWPAHLAVDK